MTAPCERCGELFEVCRDRRRFCSNQCRRGAAQTERKCDGCGVLFSTWRSDPQRYCNVDCYRSNIPRTARSETRVCQTCGDEFELLLRFRTPGKYCSRKCLGAANGARRAAEPSTRIEKPCKVCGRLMSVIPALVERKTTCSRRCNGMQALMSTRPRTSIISDDAILYWAEHGRFGRDLDWKPEHRISRWTVDLAFPDLMLVIELDGVYWHSRPGCVEKGMRRDDALNSRGWKVHHIPIEADDQPRWLAQCIDVAVAKVAHYSELSYLSGRILEAS